MKSTFAVSSIIAVAVAQPLAQPKEVQFPTCSIRMRDFYNPDEGDGAFTWRTLTDKLVCLPGTLEQPMHAQTLETGWNFAAGMLEIFDCDYAGKKDFGIDFLDRVNHETGGMSFGREGTDIEWEFKTTDDNDGNQDGFEVISGVRCRMPEVE